MDGTGGPGRKGDLGIREGRIEQLGAVTEAARETIDASGKVVAPGFVDIHTHYDAQVFWDSALSPSCFHGVTSVAGGHCGFSIAPLVPEAGDYLMRMLARVEGMPLESLRDGVPWDWRSFGEYLDRIEGRLAINAGFLVGHSALRRVVMGEDAVGHEATPEQLDAMVALLQQSLREGGIGFSSSNAPTHNDGDGMPVPSRHASRNEFVTLAGAIRDFPGTTLEFLPTVGPFDEDAKALMTDMSLAANRPLNWNVLVPSRFMPENHESQLSASDYAAERGARVVALTVPQMMSLRLNLRSGFIFDTLPGWAEVIGLPLDERRKAFEDPAVRARLEAGAASDEAGVMKVMAIWENMTIDETFAPDLHEYRGRRLGDVAQELGKTPFRRILRPLAARRSPNLLHAADPRERRRELEVPLRGLERSAGGARRLGRRRSHLDMIDTFAISTNLLGKAVRELGLLSVERAVQLLTDAPARLYGLRERGRLEPGWHADVVVFDPTTAWLRGDPYPSRSAGWRGTPLRRCRGDRPRARERAGGGAWRRAHGRAPRPRPPLRPGHGDRRGAGRSFRVLMGPDRVDENRTNKGRGIEPRPLSVLRVCCVPVADSVRTCTGDPAPDSCSRSRPRGRSSTGRKLAPAGRDCR